MGEDDTMGAVQLTTGTSSEAASSTGWGWLTAPDEVRTCLAVLDWWTADQPVPEGLAAGGAARALEVVAAAAAPADHRALMVAVERLLSWGRRWTGWQPADRAEVAEVSQDYAAALADLPEPLLRLAVERIRRDWRWPRLPRPGEVRQAVEDELAQITLARLRLRTAIGVAARPMGDVKRLAGPDQSGQAVAAAMQAAGGRVRRD